MGSDRVERLLGKVYDFRSGLSKPASAFGSGHPFLTFKDVFYNYFVPDELGDLVNSTEAERVSCDIKRGDVFLTRTSETMEELGMSCVALRDIPFATFNGFSKRLRPKPDAEIVPEFAGYFFRSPQFRRDVTAMSSMSTRASLNNDMLSQLRIVLPDFSTQSAIGNTLKALDDKIEHNRRTARALERLARAIFRAWFVEFEPVKAKAEGATSFPSMPQEVFDALPTRFVDSEIGPVPEGWEVKTLGDVCDVNARSVRAGNVTGEIEYVNISSVTAGRLDEIERLDFADEPSRARRLVRDGDTIWSCVRPNRMSYLYIHEPPENRIASTGFAVLSPKTVGPSFLYQLTTQSEFVNYLVANATGSAYPAVRADHFQTARFCCGPPAVLDAFEASTHPMRQWIGAAETEDRTLAEMRDYLLPKLLSGEVRVEGANG